MADTTYKSIHKGAQIDSAVTEVLNNLAGIQGVKVDDTELTPDTENKVNIDTTAFNIPAVVQETGTSTTSVMSQNAVTTAINDIDIPEVVQQTGTSIETVMSQNAVTNAIGDLVIPTVLQETGTSTTSVMSQDAVTDNLDLKFDKSGGNINGDLNIVYGNLTIEKPEIGWTSTLLTSLGLPSTTIQGITYGADKFIAVGSNGVIVSSLDGETWAEETSGISADLYGITYGAGKFIAIGSGGVIVRSPDGETWTEGTFGVSISPSNITYGDGKFIAIGINGEIVSSPDGETWTEETSGISVGLYGITYGADKFIAMGENGTILSSPDGETWTEETSGISVGLSKITYGDDKFIAVGAEGVILSSLDGETWAEETSGISADLIGITYGAGKFIVIVGSGAHGTILSSPDGETWREENPNSIAESLGITYGNGKFVITAKTPSPFAKPIMLSSSGEDLLMPVLDPTFIVQDNGGSKPSVALIMSQKAVVDFVNMYMGYLDEEIDEINTELENLAPLESPAFTGIPTGILQTFSVTLPYTDWTGSSAPYTKEVTVPGILGTDKPTIDLDFSDTDYADVATIQSDWANVYRAVTSEDTITFYTSTVPTADISLQIRLVR